MPDSTPSAAGHPAPQTAALCEILVAGLKALAEAGEPEAACKLVYATDGYGASVSNLAQTSLATDNVFSDGWSLQLAIVTGDVTKGMTATLNVPV